MEVYSKHLLTECDVYVSSIVDSELNKVKNTLIENGYPARFIDKQLKFDNTDSTNKELKAEQKQVFLNLSHKCDNL